MSFDEKSIIYCKECYEELEASDASSMLFNKEAILKKDFLSCKNKICAMHNVIIAVITKQSRFPIKTTMYLHSDKESNWEIGEELGLSEEAISKNFRGCLYELCVEIEVYEDGTYKILSCKE